MVLGKGGYFRLGMGLKFGHREGQKMPLELKHFNCYNMF